jgi:PIN domain nuclease of toxin-antitoxin system
MNLLLDSHALVWALNEPERLRAGTAEIIADEENGVFYSVASVWELELKAALRKLTLPENWLDGIRGSRFVELPIRTAEASRSARLPRHHRDPFDRLLVAQALEHDLHIATRDRVMERYGVRTLAI